MLVDIKTNKIVHYQSELTRQVWPGWFLKVAVLCPSPSAWIELDAGKIGAFLKVDSDIMVISVDT